ncbi:MAG: PEPxxWA-CTERM sorting domain-containing protein, partial [Novosphingobium sp.]
ANSYLANVQNNTWTGNAANVRVLSSVTGWSQNQIYITSGGVPEPSTWAMMLLGFGMIGFAMRKRSNMRTAVSYG